MDRLLKQKYFLIFISLFLSSACASKKYKTSDHFDGKKFFNPGLPGVKGFGELLKWQFEGGKVKWPDHRENTVKPQLVDKLDPKAISTTFINHATHLVQMNGLNILTDPIFSERASPFSWIGPKRARKPGMKLDELPRIDLIVISHNHYDHMDAESIELLTQKFDPLFIVPLGNAELIKDMGAKKIVELDWWEEHIIEKNQTTIKVVPTQHWSSRALFDRNEALWCGFIIKNNFKQFYYSGDTGYGEHFKKISEKFGKMDLSFLPIGAYEPRWFMKQQHMNPDDAVQAHLDVKSAKTIGTHFGTFQLTNEGIDDPVEALKVARERKNINSNDFVALEHGQTINIE